MNKTEFTSAPWVAIGEKVGVVSQEDDQSYGMINPVCWVDMYNFNKNECIANAHLISAAPEMYEALSHIASHYSLDDSVIKSIPALLARARGES